MPKPPVCPVSKAAEGITDSSAALFAPQHGLYWSTPRTAAALSTIFAFSTLACLEAHWLCLRLPSCLITHRSVYTQLLLHSAPCCLCRAFSLGLDQTSFSLYHSLLFAFSTMHCPVSAKEGLIQARMLLSHQLYISTAAHTTLGLHQTQDFTFRQNHYSRSSEMTVPGVTLLRRQMRATCWEQRDTWLSCLCQGWPKLTARQVCSLDDCHTSPGNGHHQWRAGPTLKPCFLPIPRSSY